MILAPNGRHLRVQHTYGAETLLLLNPARGKEKLMEIQQHDGVVVEAAGFQQGFAKRYWRRKRGHGREREALGLRVRLPFLPSTIYRG